MSAKKEKRCGARETCRLYAGVTLVDSVEGRISFPTRLLQMRLIAVLTQRDITATPGRGARGSLRSDDRKYSTYGALLVRISPSLLRCRLFMPYLRVLEYRYAYTCRPRADFALMDARMPTAPGKQRSCPAGFGIRKRSLIFAAYRCR